MALDKIFANVSCSDLSASISWYAALFHRVPDAQPMQGLAEWHHGAAAGFQLFENPANAGKSTLTLVVSGLRDEHLRLKEAGIEPGPVEAADYTSIVRLNDPDGNLVVLAEPGRV